MSEMKKGTLLTTLMLTLLIVALNVVFTQTSQAQTYYDFGDAPDSYSTLMASAGARHVLMDPLIYLGSCVDTETDGQPSVGANNDDVITSTTVIGSCVNGDDEDGVLLPSTLSSGSIVTAIVTTSVGCNLAAWIDFDINGDWTAPGEQIASNLALAAGPNDLVFIVPAGVGTGNTYARFRCSSDLDLSFTGEASNGEIEDYQVMLQGPPMDFGDAPDPGYPTLLVNNGARHVITGGIYLGAGVDDETNGQPNATATGDDTLDGNDDEDGVAFTSSLVPSATADVDVTANAACTLSAWLDFNGDGDWVDPGENLFPGGQALIAGVNSLNFAVPSGAVTGSTYARFRCTTDGAVTYTGQASDGEVEDYVVTIQPATDLGDASDPTYPTLMASTGASHILGSNVYLGSCVDGETDGQPSVGADGDDIAIGSPVYGSCMGDDDEDGVTFTPSLIPGSATVVTVTANAACGLSAWIDFNGDGDWSDAGEEIFSGQAIVAGIIPLSFNIPAGAAIGDTYARFRCTTDGAVTDTGQASDGEVEDYVVTIQALASIGDYVWEDTDMDGVQDGGETGVDGVTVNLYDSGGTFAGTITTAGDGSYSFSNLAPGDYYVEFVLPGGYAFSPQDQGGDDTLDSNANPVTGQTIVTTLGPGENDTTWDAGIFQALVAIGNIIWIDDGAGGGTADNSILDGTEAGVDGVTVESYNSGDTPGTDAPVATTTTAGGGYYEFDNLAPGTYFVHIPASVFGVGQPLEDYLSSTGAGADEITDHTGDENGIDDANPATNGISTMDYALQPYTEVTAEDQSNYTGTLDDDNVNFTADFGFVQPSLFTLGDFVWYDTDQNGIQDGSEPGVQNITVDLYNNGTCTAPAIGNDTTGVAGDYGFTNLLPGTYCIEFSSIPLGRTISPQGQGGDGTVDSDADPVTRQITNVSLATNNLDEDMGIYAEGSIGDTVWCDGDGDNTYDPGEGVAGVTVDLYQDIDCDTNPDGPIFLAQDTVGDGQYVFAPLLIGPPGGPPVCYYAEVDVADMGICNIAITPITYSVSLEANDPHNLTIDFGFNQQPQLASIGDYVWDDIDQDGIQDGGETGVGGVTVTLYNVGGLFTFTATAGDGSYSFVNLMPGDYSVEFELPGHYAFSPQDAGADDVDSDANPVTGRTITTTLNPGENDLTWDAGIYQSALASIGDTVWRDDNHDGTQDEVGTGIAGVTVNLYQCASPSAVFDSTSTDASGNYSFVDLVPGNYFVECVAPPNYIISPQDQGGDDAVDSDADSVTGQTTCTTLDPGENDLTWDCGMFVIGPAIQIEKEVGASGWIALNVPSVAYTLTVTNIGDVTLNPVAVTDDLDPGLNFISGSAIPTETSVTGQQIYWADVTAGAGLAPAASTQIAFQITGPITPGIFDNFALAEGYIATGGSVTDTATVSLLVDDPSVAIDKTLTPPGVVGDLVTFTIYIENTGPSAIAVLPLDDTFTGPAVYVGGDPLPDSIDNINQQLMWDDLTVPFGQNLYPGQAFYVVTVFQLTNPTTYTMINTVQVAPGGMDVYGNPIGQPRSSTAVEMINFEASQWGQSVRLSWETAAEVDTYGFRILRDDAGELSNTTEIGFVSSQLYGGIGGASYEYVDDTVVSGRTYTYWLMNADMNGIETVNGPVEVTVRHGLAVYLPIVLK
ncbi:MAG: DUF11 domain-containing protein [Chloroflexi bacterium]|nr:DUF11 domain-containing protein [Chloroflexota bacterium]